MSAGTNTGIIWPKRFAPDQAPVHVSNQRFIPVPPAVVWAWLVRAPLWPIWYANSHHVRFADGAPFADLAAGSRFRWETFGVAIQSEVLEFVATERIAWSAKGFGVDAYHAWLLLPEGDGCRVLTEESQYGWGARLMNFLFPNRMSDGHDLWLKSMEIQCRQGFPPAL
jgi:uncharacterized protein YndB with AHSA1/START domain